jgi:hypothetical protein
VRVACHIDWHLDGLLIPLLCPAFGKNLKGGGIRVPSNVQQQKSEQNSICTSAFEFECVQAVFMFTVEVSVAFIINDLLLFRDFKADGD